MTGPAAISAVLPLKVYARDYIGNPERCRILLSSLAAFAAPGLFDAIFIVVPAEERREARALQRAYPMLPLHVADENDMLPRLHRHPYVMGWRRQQLIKLAAAEMAPGEFFLTLDPDIILCKPLGLADLVVDGRALLQEEPRETQPRWWLAAARVLGIAADLSGPGMSVTPAVLSRSICRKLFAHLEQRYAEPWTVALLRQVRTPWTEYTLYRLAAEHYGMTGAFHLPAGDAWGRRLICPSNTAFAEEFPAWDVAGCFDPEAPGFFAIVQGNTGIPPAAIRERIAAYLALPELPPPRRLRRLRAVWYDRRRWAARRLNRDASVSNEAPS